MLMNSINNDQVYVHKFVRKTMHLKFVVWRSIVVIWDWVSFVHWIFNILLLVYPATPRSVRWFFTSFYGFLWAEVISYFSRHKRFWANSCNLTHLNKKNLRICAWTNSDRNWSLCKSIWEASGRVQADYVAYEPKSLVRDILYLTLIWSRARPW